MGLGPLAVRDRRRHSSARCRPRHQWAFDRIPHQRRRSRAWFHAGSRHADPLASAVRPGRAHGRRLPPWHDRARSLRFAARQAGHHRFEPRGGARPGSPRTRRVPHRRHADGRAIPQGSPARSSLHCARWPVRRLHRLDRDGIHRQDRAVPGRARRARRADPVQGRRRGGQRPSPGGQGAGQPGWCSRARQAEEADPPGPLDQPRRSVRGADLSDAGHHRQDCGVRRRHGERG